MDRDTVEDIATGNLFDACGAQFCFHTEVPLNDGEYYSIDFKRIDETTIRITDAWNLTENPYVP